MGIQSDGLRAVLVSCIFVYCHTQSTCDPPWQQIDDGCYRILFQRQGFRSALEADDACYLKGGVMTSMTSRNVERQVLEAIKNLTKSHEMMNKAYIGLSDILEQNRFYWFNGERLRGRSYSNWATDEPNNNYDGGPEDCAVLRSDDFLWEDNGNTHWRDYPCCVNYGISVVACEKPKTINRPRYNKIVQALETQCLLEERNECDSNPCYNEGRCEDGVRRFECVCDHKFYGDLCQYRKTCGCLPMVANADADTQDIFYGSLVTWTCHIGYKFPDDALFKQMLCDFDGNWQPQNTPSCEIITCPGLPTWTGVTIIESSPNTVAYELPFHTSVTYTCSNETEFDKDFHGPMSSICGLDGLWNPPIIPCKERKVKANAALEAIKEPVEAEGAEEFGYVGISVMIGELVLLLMIDMPTLIRHAILFCRNIWYPMKKWRYQKRQQKKRKADLKVCNDRLQQQTPPCFNNNNGTNGFIYEKNNL